MSAFIVSTGTMQRAVAAFQVTRHESMSCTQADELGKRLYNLNFDAIHQRYPDTKESGQYPGPIDVPVPDEFKFRLTQYSPDTHDQKELCTALKGLRCLIYQCSEGNVPETQLYSEMEKASNLIAYRLLDTIPEYQDAPWDV